MEQVNLFENKISQPLAARLRPEDLDEFVGQEHLIGEGKVIRNLIETGSGKRPPAPQRAEEIGFLCQRQ